MRLCFLFYNVQQSGTRPSISLINVDRDYHKALWVNSVRLMYNAGLPMLIVRDLAMFSCTLDTSRFGISISNCFFKKGNFHQLISGTSRQNCTMKFGIQGQKHMVNPNITTVFSCNNPIGQHLYIILFFSRQLCLKVLLYSFQKKKTVVIFGFTMCFYPCTQNIIVQLYLEVPKIS